MKTGGLALGPQAVDCGRCGRGRPATTRRVSGERGSAWRLRRRDGLTFTYGSMLNVSGMKPFTKSVTPLASSSLPNCGLEVRLASRPVGLPALDHFEIVEAPVPVPAPGQVLVRNLFMSLDPGMLMLIAGGSPLPMPHYAVGEAMYGDAIGEVVASADSSLSEGELVVHRLGWREYAVAEASAFRRVDKAVYPSPSLHLGFGL